MNAEHPGHGRPVDERPMPEGAQHEHRHRDEQDEQPDAEAREEPQHQQDDDRQPVGHSHNLLLTVSTLPAAAAGVNPWRTCCRPSGSRRPGEPMGRECNRISADRSATPVCRRRVACTQPIEAWAGFGWGSPAAQASIGYRGVTRRRCQRHLGPAPDIRYHGSISGECRAHRRRGNGGFRRADGRRWSAGLASRCGRVVAHDGEDVIAVALGFHRTHARHAEQLRVGGGPGRGNGPQVRVVRNHVGRHPVPARPHPSPLHQAIHELTVRVGIPTRWPRADGAVSAVPAGPPSTAGAAATAPRIG